MIDIFHTSDGCVWDRPGFSAQDRETQDLIISLVEKKLPPSTWVKYLRFRRSNPLEVFAYLLSAAGPSDPKK